MRNRKRFVSKFTANLTILIIVVVIITIGARCQQQHRTVVETMQLRTTSARTGTGRNAVSLDYTKSQETFFHGILFSLGEYWKSMTYADVVLKREEETEVKNLNDNRKNIKNNDQLQRSLEVFNCSECFKHDFRYLINNAKVCEDESSIDLLFLIFTVHKNVQERNALRKTWLTFTKNNTGTVRYVFLLGYINNPSLNEAVVKENEQYKDIIQENFIDVYVNLTYKTIMGYKWVLSNCPRAKVVAKTDDDMFINIPNMLQKIHDNKDILNNTIVGACSEGQQPVRSRASKWYASILSYPGTQYPSFCSGTCYLTSIELVQKLYTMSSDVPFFHLEDVYIGMCLYKLGGKVKRLSGFHISHPDLDPCLYKGSELVTSHMVTPENLVKVWHSECVPRSKK